MSEIDHLGPRPKTLPTHKIDERKYRQANTKADKKLRKKNPKPRPDSDHQVDEYV